MRLEKQNVQRIRTPEGIAFSLPLAGLMTRVLARLVDLAIMAAIIIGMAVVLSFVGGLLSWLTAMGGDVTVALIMVGSFFVAFGYNIFFEWFWKGQTPGKKAFRLRVVDEYGLGLRFGQIAIRNLLRVADALPVVLIPFCYPFGLVSMILSRSNQRLGDRVAGTIVVKIPQLLQPDWTAITTGKFNSFREHPHLAARLRQAVTPREAEVALQCLLRRDDFIPAARTELFAQLADHFRERIRLPEEVTFGLSDEHYVRNLVEVVYRCQSEEEEQEAATGTTAEEPAA